MSWGWGELRCSAGMTRPGSWTPWELASCFRSHQQWSSESEMRTFGSSMWSNHLAFILPELDCYLWCLYQERDSKDRHVGASVTPHRQRQAWHGALTQYTLHWVREYNHQKYTTHPISSGEPRLEKDRKYQPNMRWNLKIKLTYRVFHNSCRKIVAYWF